MDQIGPKLRTQINLVLLEADMGDDGGDCVKNCMDYKKFIAFLEDCGLEMVDKRNDCDSAWHGAPAGTWCGNWIWHYAFRRKSPSSAAFLSDAVPKLEVAVAEVAKDDVRPEAIATLKADALFMSKRPVAGQAKTAADNCDNWEGLGFICGIEFPEHKLVQDHLPSGATVMEFGARFGSTSCEIAKKIGNSGRVVSVEPDRGVWDNLEHNLQLHDCRVHVLRGVLGSKPLKFSYSNYASRTEEVSGDGQHEWGVIPNFQFDEVEEALGVKFDALLIDCEGCAQQMMDQIGPKLKTQIDLVLLEADMGDDGGDCVKNCMDYKKFIALLEDSGLRMVEKRNDCDSSWHGAPAGTWCGNWIWHYAFRRKSPSSAAFLSDAVPKLEVAVAEVAKDDVRPEAIATLKADRLFMSKSETANQAKTAADNCDNWEGLGFICGIEFPEHKLVRDHLPSGATVMEFGARFGSTSCEIAKKIGNSGRVVSVEPDRGV